MPFTASTPSKRKRIHQLPKPITPELLAIDDARVRISHWLFLLGGISASTFYVRLEAGKIPAPCGHDPKPFWRAQVVREYLAGPIVPNVAHDEAGFSMLVEGIPKPGPKKSK